MPIIPLEVCIRIMKGSGLTFNVEIKGYDRDTAGVVIDLFAKHEMLDRLYFSSFVYYHKLEMRKACEQRGIDYLNFGYLAVDSATVYQDWVREFHRTGDMIILPNYFYSGLPEMFDELKEQLKDIDIQWGCYYDFKF